MSPLTTPVAAWNHGTNVEGLQTSKECADAAGLQWGVTKAPLTAHLYKGEVNGVALYLDQPVKREFTITRDDNDVVLGIVGKNFRPVPNLEAFALLDSLAEESESKFEYAGYEGDGERVWMKVKYPREIRIKDNPDEVVSFSMFLTNAFNGSKSLVMHFAPILDKQATILNPSNFKQDTMSIRHTRKYDEHIKEVRKVLKLGNAYFDTVEDMFNNLADIKVNDSKFLEVMNSILPLPITDPTTGKAPNSTKVEGAREKLSQLRTEQNVLSQFPDTGWSTFVAISNYADHERSFKSRKDEAGSRDSIRFLSILEGASQAIKNEALEILLNQ
jgi:phage/plasmid-like protein (TIGR03299 family)